MSQGLTWIAGRRTPLLALVALLALSVALFAVIQSASAANAVKITINDSDNVVKAGSGYSVNVAVFDGDLENSDEWTLEYITVTGGVFLANIPSGDDAVLQDGAADTEATLVVPANAEGVYTITAGVVETDDNDAATVEARLVGTLEVTVGDVGTPIGSVEVVLSKVDGDGAHSTATTDKVDKSQKRFGEDIAVTVNVLNSPRRQAEPH